MRQQGPTLSVRATNMPVGAARAALEQSDLPAEDLVFHRSDLSVRPLIGNRCGMRLVYLLASLHKKSPCVVCAHGAALHEAARPASFCSRRWQTS